MSTILVIDDHPMNREFLVTLLGYQKHRMLEAADGLQALEIIKKESVNLIISDILMPNLDGYELAQILRADPVFMKIPIVFYTATYSTREANLLAKACGVSMVITKPAEPQEILDKIGTILGVSLPNKEVPLEVTHVKKTSRMHLGDNLSLFLGELDTTNQYLNKQALASNQTLGTQDTYDELASQIKSLQENSLKMSALIKLGFNLITERDPLRMFKLFSRTACSIIKAHRATIGIIDNQERLSGRFCITTMTEKIDSYYSDTCVLPDSVLRPLFMGKNVIRFSNLNEISLINHAFVDDFSNQAFLGIPIASSTQKYGVIYFSGKRDTSEFNEEDEHIIATMAAELAVLYENITLYDMIQQHAVKLQLEVTERKNIENELRHSEERLKLALDTAHMNGWEWNMQTNEVKEFGYIDPLSRNDAYHPENGSFDNVLSNIYPDDREKVMRVLQKAIQLNTEYEAEFRSCKTHDAIKWIAARGQIFSDEQGKPQRMVGVAIDITERKKTEQLARHHQTELAYIARVSSMGEMASALAHELNQPLTVINSYVSGCIHRLEKNTDEKESIIDAMKKAMQHVELAGQIIHRMKNFVRHGELHYEIILINDLIKEALRLIQYEIQDISLTINLELAEDLPKIEVDKIQIEQVLLNLMRNGFEAMLTAKTPKPILTISTEYLTSHVIKITIKDNGPGINMNMKDRLFVPYFTSKTRGMGMGLAICRTIIEGHGGQISAQTSLEGGACFQFTLPVTQHE